jgi:hypothetical protein
VSWRDAFASLRQGHFAGRGGLKLLSEALGVAQITVRKWNQGRWEPNAENRRKLRQLAARSDDEIGSDEEIGSDGSDEAIGSRDASDSVTGLRYER